ncbi:hypothetical protein L0F63_005474, partial [Massospora cicadina]
AARAGCSQESPSCRRCIKLGRNCTYISFELRDSPCLTCRTRKKRCDRRRPVCQACDRLGLGCQYDRRGSLQDVQILATRSKIQLMAKVCYRQERLDLLQMAKRRSFNNILSRCFQYDMMHLHMKFLDGRIVSNVNPMMLLKDLSGALTPGDQIIICGKHLECQKSASPNFFVTSSLVKSLIQLFFDRINPHQPVLSEDYFRFLEKYHSNAPETILLTYTLCLHGSTLFPDAQLVSVLKHVFASLVFKLLAQCYSHPSLPLIIAYLLLALIPLSELDHPRALPQRYYYAMALRLVFQLGIHLPCKLPNSVATLRRNLAFNVFLVEITVNSNSVDSSTTDLESIQLKFLNFILSQLHKAMIVYCPPDVPGFIHIPTNPALIHRFCLYCNTLADLYHLRDDRITVNEFQLLPKESKCLVAISLYCRTLLVYSDDLSKTHPLRPWLINLISSLKAHLANGSTRAPSSKPRDLY